MLTAMKANRLKECVIERYTDIDTDEIIAIRMGDSQPRIVIEEIHQQYDFLPVGRVLDMEFCRTIPDHKNREIAHGLNRRTVVKNYTKMIFNILLFCVEKLS